MSDIQVIYDTELDVFKVNGWYLFVAGDGAWMACRAAAYSAWQRPDMDEPEPDFIADTFAEAFRKAMLP